MEMLHIGHCCFLRLNDIGEPGATNVSVASNVENRTASKGTNVIMFTTTGSAKP
jgi:hypothetical protein